MTSDGIIDILLGGPDPDPGCDATMSQLAAWADQKQAGLDADAAFPGVAAHPAQLRFLPRGRRRSPGHAHRATRPARVRNPPEPVGSTGPRWRPAGLLAPRWGSLCG